MTERRHLRAAPLAVAVATLTLVACGGPLDVGSNRDSGLPVGPENPVILLNDTVTDNWQGEYALLLAHGGGPSVLGVVVSTGGLWTDLESNVSGWSQLLADATASGLPEVADLVSSASSNLERPEDDDIDATPANGSSGARYIVERSESIFAETSKPVVIAAGGRLTDVADAYLLDPSVVERVVVVASAGSNFDEADSSADVGRPNGEMDPWASEIVIQRFTYVQVGAHYDQTTDVPESRLDELPDAPFGDWLRLKRSQIDANPVAADQVSILAAALPEFVSALARVSPAAVGGDVPTLKADDSGSSYLVTTVDGTVATNRFWQLLGTIQ